MIWMIERARGVGALFGVIIWALPVNAVECSTQNFAAQDFVVCEVDASEEDLRLFLNDPQNGRPLGSFGNLADMLDREGRELQFAMNAGMYHLDRSPVGLFVENSTEQMRVITSDGPGNFGLLPNGVFCIRPGRADVIETLQYVRDRTECRFASQSGPMLVIDGALHPRFLEDSDSLFIRNGVGTSGDGRFAFFVISENPLNFHTFARFFRDHLGVPQALYFDGNISRLFAPDLDRQDGGFPMGPIVGVVSEASR